MYRAQGKYTEAEGLFKRALASARKRSVRTTPTWARPSTTWPSCIEPRASTARRRGSSKRALAIREKALGANHPDVGQTLNNLANVYRDQGKYREAEELHKRALAIREKALGTNHPDVGQTLNNLANVYRSPGQVQRGGGALQARAGDPGKSARCEPP